MDDPQTCGDDGATAKDTSETRCRVLPCRVNELRPHPSYVRHQLSVSAFQLLALAALGSLAFREPIVLTRNLRNIDGYARFQ